MRLIKKVHRFKDKGRLVVVAVLIYVPPLPRPFLRLKCVDIVTYPTSQQNPWK